MLETILYPKSVAVCGASRTPGKVGYELLKNLSSYGYVGDIIPVNREAESILGMRCYASLADYDEDVDLAVITVPASRVLEVATDALDAGAQALAVIAAGFRELGPSGAALERELRELCRARRVPLMGPNALGVINTDNGMNASFSGRMPAMGVVSVISQSGALCTAILDWAAGRHLGLAKLISLGNKADLDEIAFLRALDADEQTRVIVGYLESIEDGDRFVKVAEQVSGRKPVVILKAGTTPAGSRAALAHTGSRAGIDIAYGAAFRRAGIIRAETLEQLFDYGAAFALQPLPPGDGVAIVTNAGGPGIVAADAVEHSGMSVATLQPETIAALKEILPEAASARNPIDVVGDADPDRYEKVLSIVRRDPNVHACVVILTPQAMTRPAETARVLARAAGSDKPLLAAFLGGTDVLPGRDELAVAGLPDYESPERAVGALAAMHEYSQWRRRPPRVVARFPVNRRRVDRILTRFQRIGTPRLSEPAAKEVMRAYDFNVPRGDIARSAEEAIATAERIGYPVALKVVCPGLVNKSGFGGVRLGLAGPDSVLDAYDLMMLRVRRRLPDAHIEGVYVEQMVCKRREVIVGMTRDPRFGPMLKFGIGGLLVEVMEDVAFHLAPITAGEARQMLQATRSYSMLAGNADEAAALEGIAHGIQRLSQLVTDFPQISELRINPFVVCDPGEEPYVVDCSIALVEE